MYYFHYFIFFVIRNFPPKDRVMRTVTMTKCLYAMLVQQKYNPEKRTGWNLVNTSDSQYKAQITGIKIVSEFIYFFLNTVYLVCFVRI